MLEIDATMVSESRKHLPEWSDCSNIVGSADSCFDDPRTELHTKDAIMRFVENFKYLQRVDPAMKFDVIIMDAL
jgi:spermidine synthase